MKIDELRSTLHEHGDGVEPQSHATRLQEVHGRIRTARRRRTAVAVGGTAATVAAIALAVVPNLQQDPTPAPAGPDQVAGYSKDGVTFRDEVLGERLLGAVLGDAGESQVKTVVVVGEEGLRFSPTCYGTGTDRMVTYSLAGSSLGAVSCQQAKDPDPGADGVTFDATPEEVLEDLKLEPGDTASFVLRLVDADDSNGPTVFDPEAVIGGGVYEDTRATRVVAGAEVPERVEHESRVWELQSTLESVRSSEDVRIVTDGRGEEADTLVGFAISGLDSPSAWDIRLDGDVVDSAERGRGVDGPTFGPWRSFEQGEAYDVRLVVTKGLTERTRLALLTYAPAG